MNRIIFEIVKFIVSWFFISWIVDIFIMGWISFRFNFPKHLKAKKFFCEANNNHVDFQKGPDCSGYSTAYLLRHYGENVTGSEMYEKIIKKKKNGTVTAKNILQPLREYGKKLKYVRGNLTSLKNEVAKGVPVIVVIRGQLKGFSMHFAVVTGYDEEYIYLADSVESFTNVEKKHLNAPVPTTIQTGEASMATNENAELGVYNRRLTTKEFKKYWNTAQIWQPLYRNTFYVN